MFCDDEKILIFFLFWIQRSKQASVKNGLIQTIVIYVR